MEYDVSSYSSGPSTFTIVLGILLGLINLISEWILYQKAGRPGWAVLIPFYNLYVMMQIMGRNGWQMLLILVPFVNVIMAIIWTYNFIKCYTKSTGMAVAGIFFPYIVYPILAFGKAEYLREK